MAECGSRAGVAIDPDRLAQAYRLAIDRLAQRREPGGWWAGRLSSSALSTATAISALCLVGRDAHASLVDRALHWLRADQNADGGWGDTPESPSNLPTTLLVTAAAGLARCADPFTDGAEAFLASAAGPTAADRLAAVSRQYGADRTFAVPILTNLALAGQVAWSDVPSLPFELGCLPHALLRSVRLHVVSYAKPALIAIGQLLHRRNPTRMPVLRQARSTLIGRALRQLEAIQPASGGFLEAIPLTSFVVMSLAASVGAEHPVARRGTEFLLASVRPDGSWPIDMDLSCWVTTQAVEALGEDEQTGGLDLHDTIEWIGQRQHTRLHPFTQTRPGGWAWTYRSGGVPDVDDTAGALVALGRHRRDGDLQAAVSGVGWLLDLQNADGGWPTFCRGWAKLPFDRSSPDLTAHALRALALWPEAAPRRRVDRARARAWRYLERVQGPEGAWAPLWFGNQATAGKRNPVFGTARVLRACQDLGRTDWPPARRGLDYLLACQGREGAWGGDSDAPPTIEETALAIDAMAGWSDRAQVLQACARAGQWLIDRILAGGLDRAAPIGLYFAMLWYSEQLYPIVWSVAALGRLRTLSA